jgi:hemoglobin
MENSTPSLFERLGGQEKIDLMIQSFYERVLLDPELAPFFARSDIGRLTAMQREFFSIGLDGPIEYPSRRLAATHHGRGIRRSHFALFCKHMLDTLLSHGLDPKDADQVLVRLSMYSESVVGDTGVDG